MLEVVCATVAAAGIPNRIVALGARADEITEQVDLHGATAVVCQGWREGQAASLRCALDALDPAIGEALVVLGDGPALSPEAVRRLAAGSGPRAADYGRGRSHPVVLPRSTWQLLPALGETPGRSVEVGLVDCRDLPEPGDVDYAAP